MNSRWLLVSNMSEWILCTANWYKSTSLLPHHLLWTPDYSDHYSIAEISFWQQCTECQWEVHFTLPISHLLCCYTRISFIHSVCSKQDDCVTCNRKNPHISHAANVLKSKISDLWTPPQKQRAQCQHGGDVANTNITNVNTSEKYFKI